jgi:xanthine dehydrogenase accessory factor
VPALSNSDFAKKVFELTEKGLPFVVATVVRIEGSALGKPGFKAIVSKTGKIEHGTLGGVCPESAIATMATRALKTGEAKTVKVFLENEEKAIEGTIRSQSEDEIHVETNCGGMLEIFVEPYLPPERLILIGQGGKDDVEDSLVKLGKMLSFRTVVIDHHPVLSEEPDVLVKELDFDLSKFEFETSDSIVLLTKGSRDVPTLKQLSKSGVRFVGLLASRQRVKDDLEALRKANVSSSFIDSLHAPAGADIGAITPFEIALSIMADIIGSRRGKHLPHKQMEIETRIR